MVTVRTGSSHIRRVGVAGATAFYAANAYDALGGVTAVTETIAGTLTQAEYTYNAIGQFVDVRTDGAVSVASYDESGNRAGAESLESTFDTRTASSLNAPRRTCTAPAVP